jgi:hypothetical protein
MPALKLRRIDLSANTAAAQIIKLRDQFRIDSDVVPAASKKLTQSVFGTLLSPAQAAARICEEVKEKGLPAVLHYTELLDKVKLKPEMVAVQQTDPVQRAAIPVRALASRCRNARFRSTRIAPAISAHGTSRRLLSRRSGSLPFDLDDDDLPSSGSRSRENRCLHASQRHRCL